ncbi:MAG: NAD-binding protein, partial [Actinomycetota bacterium]|nr:NAD-binding protein [Actinomycetota bacterium]
MAASERDDRPTGAGDGGFAGRRVLVAGAGVSGLAAAAALLEVGAHVTVTDARPAALADLPPGAEAGDDPDA